MSETTADQGQVANRQDTPVVQPSHVGVEGIGSELAVVATFRSGPLPAADEVAVYEQVLSGAFDRILSMAEEQAKHRRQVEAQTVDCSLRLESRGQILGFCLVLLGFLSATALIAFDKSLPGASAAVLSALAVLVAVFMRHKRERTQAATANSDATTLRTRSLIHSPGPPTVD